MRQIATVALMFHIVIAGVYAQQTPVKMKFSGSNVTSTLDLQPNTVTQEVLFAGNGTLGPFTYRELNAHIPVPQPSSTCSGLNIQFPLGAGVFRFQDGSLLTVKITVGDVCLDPATLNGNFTVNYQITGGTRRFKDASGSLTLTSTGRPVLFDASNEVVFFTNTGEFEGTVLGVAAREGGQDERQ
jgi:hypothetical protein